MFDNIEYKNPIFKYMLFWIWRIKLYINKSPFLKKVSVEIYTHSGNNLKKKSHGEPERKI